MRKLEKLNSLVATYVGLMARWKSSGGKGKVPEEIIEVLDQIDIELNKILSPGFKPI